MCSSCTLYAFDAWALMVLFGIIQAERQEGQPAAGITACCKSHELQLSYSLCVEFTFRYVSEVTPVCTWFVTRFVLCKGNKLAQKFLRSFVRSLHSFGQSSLLGSLCFVPNSGVACKRAAAHSVFGHPLTTCVVRAPCSDNAEGEEDDDDTGSDIMAFYTDDDPCPVSGAGWDILDDGYAPSAALHAVDLDLRDCPLVRPLDLAYLPAAPPREACSSGAISSHMLSSTPAIACRAL